MAQNSKIEWTKHTANLWWGCTKVHEGCDHCYAETTATRWGQDVWGNDKPRVEVKSIWKDLIKFQRLAEAVGEVHSVFVGSMMDIFEKPMPLVDRKGKVVTWDVLGEVRPMYTDDVRKTLFEIIDNGMYPNLMFLFLTKRPSNINKMIPESWKDNPPSNVMFGTSPVNQATANKLIPQLLQVNGKRFLSVEPQLGEVDLQKLYKENEAGQKSWTDCLRGTVYVDEISPCHYSARGKIHWVIQGGESGHGRRTFDLAWARSMREQCKAAGIPYFFKQIDKVLPIPKDLMVREFPVHSNTYLHKQ